jgi:hypothetical protein
MCVVPSGSRLLDRQGGNPFAVFDAIRALLGADRVGEVRERCGECDRASLVAAGPARPTFGECRPEGW